MRPSYSQTQLGLCSYKNGQQAKLASCILQVKKPRFTEGSRRLKVSWMQKIEPDYCALSTLTRLI